jgi:hypothetical protein
LVVDLVHIAVESVAAFVVAVGIVEDVIQVRLVALLYYIIGCFPQADIPSFCEGHTIICAPFNQIDGVSVFKVIATVKVIGLSLGRCLDSLLPNMLFSL